MQPKSGIWLDWTKKRVLLRGVLPHQTETIQRIKTRAGGDYLLDTLGFPGKQVVRIKRIKDGRTTEMNAQDAKALASIIERALLLPAVDINPEPIPWEDPRGLVNAITV